MRVLTLAFTVDSRRFKVSRNIQWQTHITMTQGCDNVSFSATCRDLLVRTFGIYTPIFPWNIHLTRFFRNAIRNNVIYLGKFLRLRTLQFFIGNKNFVFAFEGVFSIKAKTQFCAPKLEIKLSTKLLILWRWGSKIKTGTGAVAIVTFG